MARQAVFDRLVHDGAFLHDEPAGHDGVVGPSRATAQQRLDRVAEGAGEHRPVEPPANQVPHRPRPEHARARPGGRGRPLRPSVASSRAWRAPVDAAPERYRARSSAVRASSQREAESADEEPSQPRPTGAPAARSSATGAMPVPSRQVGARAMSDADPRPSEALDLGRARVDAVSHP